MWIKWAHRLINAPELLEKWRDNDKGWFNLIYEQSMIANLCKDQELKVAFVIPRYNSSFKHFLATSKHQEANKKLVRDRLKFEERYSTLKIKA